MKQQIKKRLSALLVYGCVLGIIGPLTSYAADPQIEISDVADQESVIEEAAIFKTGWVTTCVNIRKEPNTNCEILATLDSNSQIMYADFIDGWSQVIYNNQLAYIKSEYISETKNIIISPYRELINSFTQEEKELLYQITFAEAGNQTLEGQRAVIEVILNRILSNQYPNTLVEVLSQKGQFTSWNVRNKVKHNQEQEIALDLVYSETPILNINYLTFSIGKNSWGKNYVKIDNQYFGTF
jgi:hypothetical protein